MPDLPEDLGSSLVLVLLQAFWCPDSDSNTLPMVRLTFSFKVAKGGGHRTRCGRELHLHRTTVRVCCIAIHVPVTDHLSVVYPQAGEIPMFPQ